eukprot:5484853-Pyramimonas_sp.AAC.1
MAPTALPRLPRALQEGPERRPGGPNRSPRGLQNAAKRPPRGPDQLSEAPETLQEASTGGPFLCVLPASLIEAIPATRRPRRRRMQQAATAAR